MNVKEVEVGGSPGEGAAEEEGRSMSDGGCADGEVSGGTIEGAAEG